MDDSGEDEESNSEEEQIKIQPKIENDKLSFEVKTS